MGYGIGQVALKSTTDTVSNEVPTRERSGLFYKENCQFCVYQPGRLLMRRATDPE